MQNISYFVHLSMVHQDAIKVWKETQSLLVQTLFSSHFQGVSAAVQANPIKA